MWDLRNFWMLRGTLQFATWQRNINLAIIIDTAKAHGNELQGLLIRFLSSFCSDLWARTGLTNKYIRVRILRNSKGNNSQGDPCIYVHLFYGKVTFNSGKNLWFLGHWFKKKRERERKETGITAPFPCKGDKRLKLDAVNPFLGHALDALQKLSVSS